MQEKSVYQVNFRCHVCRLKEKDTDKTTRGPLTTHRLALKDESTYALACQNCSKSFLLEHKHSGYSFLHAGKHSRAMQFSLV